MKKKTNDNEGLWWVPLTFLCLVSIVGWWLPRNPNRTELAAHLCKSGDIPHEWGEWGNMFGHVYHKCKRCGKEVDYVLTEYLHTAYRDLTAEVDAHRATCRELKEAQAEVIRLQQHSPTTNNMHLGAQSLMVDPGVTLPATNLINGCTTITVSPGLHYFDGKRNYPLDDVYAPKEVE